MSARTFRGSPNWKNGIPANSKIRIVTLPEATVVYESDRVTESHTVDLDPGFYHVVIKKFIGKNAAGRLSQIRWEERFFHEVSPEEYTALSNTRPMNAKARMTSSGWTLFCGHQGCEYACSNSIAMILHELKHQGVTKEEFLKDADYIMDQASTNATAIITAAEDAPKKRGRPRSFHSES